MEFVRKKAKEYRAMSAADFEARKREVADLCLDPGCDADPAELRAEAEVIKAESERRAVAAELRQTRAAAVAAGEGAPVGAQPALVTLATAPAADDPTATVEYRTAFMGYVMHGTRSDVLDEVAQTRANANTKTTDVSAVSPTVLVNRSIEKAETYGMILPLVTKTSYPAGVEIPVATLKPVATWVSEGAGSDRQKYTATQKLTFTHHKLRCEVSISMEVSVMALSAFEDRLVETVAKAIVVAKEKAIINGTGSGQPKGILAETPAAGQALEIESGAGLSYQTLCDAEAALPQAYEAGAKWFMSKRTFMSFVGMTDDNGQPIARVNYGIGGKPERTLLGRDAVLTGDYLPDFAKAPEADTVFAFLFDMSDYIMNSVYDMGIQRKQDWDTEDMLTKAVTACDGKVADVNSLVTLKVKKAATTPGG